jgi:putative Mn2+ efflux pump MntP
MTMTEDSSPAHASPETYREHSLGELLSALGADSSLLIRQEIQLAQTEMKEKAVAAGVGFGITAAGIVLLLGAYAAGVTAAIAGFRNLLPLWAAALCTLGAFGLAALILLLLGMLRLRSAGPPVPQRAIQTAKETPGELVH